MKLESVLKTTGIGAMIVVLGCMVGSGFLRYEINNKKEAIQEIADQNPQLKIEAPPYEHEKRTVEYAESLSIIGFVTGSLCFGLVDYGKYGRKKKIKNLQA